MSAMSETADGVGSVPTPPPIDLPEAPGEAGRARSRRLASGIATSLVSRGVAALAPLILVPITLTYLGPDLYGLWMTVASVTSMMLWADFGLGNGLLTRLAPCYANRDWGTARRYVSTTYAVLLVTAAALIGLLFAISAAVPWASLFKVSDAGLAPAARQIALICLSAVLVNIPLSLIQRVQYACQQVAQSNLWQAGGGLLAVAFAAGAVYAHAAPTLVVAASVAGPLVVNAINSAVVYSRVQRRISPHPAYVDRRFARSLLQLGGQFFILSIVTSAALNVDNLIVARTLGLTAVTEYSVPVKLFTALGLVVTLVNLPLWPANGEALARGDIEWVRRTTRRMTLLSGGAVLVPSVVLILSGDAIITAWTGTDLAAPPLLLAGLAAWWFLLAVTSPSFMVQNAAGLVRPQLLGWTAFLLTSVPLKWIAAREIGVAGVPLVGAALYLAFVWSAARVGYRRTLRDRSFEKLEA
jgi:O-antigen/teichoic acid export membrane protein